MGKKVRSARGVVIDFDLMKIKEQIASAPTPLEVKARQNFIESRLKRRLKKAQATVVESTTVEAEPAMPAPAAIEEPTIDTSIEEDIVAEEEKKKPAKKKRVTKQKARPTKTSE